MRRLVLILAAAVFLLGADSLLACAKCVQKWTYLGDGEIDLCLACDDTACGYERCALFNDSDGNEVCEVEYSGCFDRTDYCDEVWYKTELRPPAIGGKAVWRLARVEVIQRRGRKG